MRDNDYTPRVYVHDQDDADLPPIVRALHAELCRIKPHDGGVWPACERAWSVMRRWEADKEFGRATAEPAAPEHVTEPDDVKEP